MHTATSRTRRSPLVRARGFGIVLAVLTASPVIAAPPTDAGERAAIVDQPASVDVLPANVALSGVRDARQLVVSGKYADGSVRDLTGVVAAKVEPADVVELQEGLYLRQSISCPCAFSISSNRSVAPSGLRRIAISVRRRNSDSRDSDVYSFMKIISNETLDPKTYSVKHLADSVLPTPVGPRNRKLHLGRFPLSFNPSSAAWIARAILPIAAD
jgi:hypothetical protein